MTRHENGLLRKPRRLPFAALSLGVRLGRGYQQPQAIEHRGTGRHRFPNRS
jgi:hypothetical protein